MTSQFHIRSLLPAHLGAAFIVASFCFGVTRAETVAAKVSLADGFDLRRRSELTGKLRAITGWSDLHFDDQGRLQLGQNASSTGSASARVLLAKAVSSHDHIVLEDASSRNDVVFCQVVRQFSKSEEQGTPTVIRSVRIDFDDFEQLMGDAMARQAFDVAWGLLHELDHVVNRSRDAEGLGGPGSCETNINAMRRELGLPERVDYFYTVFPSVADDFKSRFVRLAFERSIAPGKKKRYWILWDAALVGENSEHRQIASVK